MAKRIVYILLALSVAVGLVLGCYDQVWFQTLGVVALWDIGRTVVQTWYLRRTIGNARCPKCGACSLDS